MRRRRMQVSYLECPVCGSAATVPRPMSRKRPRGHVKTMWCPMCKDVRDFVERGVE